MEIIAILAMDHARLIGSNNSLPWHIPEDLRRFREFTTGYTVLMGKNTYFSLPEKVRPLPNRRNIVMTRGQIDGVETFSSIDEFLKSMQVGNVGKVYLIGGATLYNQFFERGLVDRVELTLIDGEHSGDVFVDEFRHLFTLENTQKFSQGEFQTWTRIS